MKLTMITVKKTICPKPYHTTTCELTFAVESGDAPEAVYSITANEVNKALAAHEPKDVTKSEAVAPKSETPTSEDAPPKKEAKKTRKKRSASPPKEKAKKDVPPPTKEEIDKFVEQWSEQLEKTNEEMRALPEDDDGNARYFEIVDEEICKTLSLKTFDDIYSIDREALDGVKKRLGIN